MNCSQVYWKCMKCPVIGFWVPVRQECSAVGRLLFALNAASSALAVLCTHSSFNSLVKDLSAFLCLSFTLMTNEPMGPSQGQGAKVEEHFGIGSFFKWAKDTLWYKVKSYGRNSYAEGRSLSRKICTLTYGRDQSAIAPYQADKSWRHKSAENQIALAEMLKTSLHF